MTHRQGGPFGERTEAEIREWVRDRDAGPAPERLRMRIARVAESEPAPRWGFRAVLRPAYALGGAVAAAALIVVAMVLRATPGPAAPGASATPSGPSPEPTTVLMPAMPNGPWPRTGPVLAVPLDGPLLVAVAVLALLAALLIVTWTALVTRREARRSEPPLTWSWLAAAGRVRSALRRSMARGLGSRIRRIVFCMRRIVTSTPTAVASIDAAMRTNCVMIRSCPSVA